MVELLVVIGVIGVLMSLLFAVLPLLRTKARETTTMQRMEQVLVVLSQVAQGGASATWEFQRKIPHFGGTESFVGRKPQGGGAWHLTHPNPAANWSDRSVPMVFAYPWGKTREYFGLEDWYRATLSLPQSDNKHKMSRSDQELWKQPESHNLSDLRTSASQGLLQAARVLNGDDAAAQTEYADRNPDEPWNDAWGQPLVLAHAVFQPPEHQRGPFGTTAASDEYLRAALQAYGYNRSTYVSVASAGRTGLSTNPADMAARCEAVWQQANAVCNTDKAGQERWRVDASYNAMVNPPWVGVELTDHPDHGRARALLAAPIELQ